MMSKEGERESGNRLENIAESTKDYLDLKIDSLKLQLVEKFSILSAKGLSLAIVIALGGMAVIFFGFALSWYLGSLLESQAIGNLITGAIFLIFGIIFFAIGGRLFLNKIITIYSGLFFDQESDSVNSQSYRFSEISDRGRLRKEIRRLDKKIEIQSSIVSSDYQKIKSGLSPAKIAIGMLSKVAGFYPAFKMFSNIIKRGREKIK